MYSLNVLSSFCQQSFANMKMMPLYVPYVLYKHVKIVSYNSNTTSKEALGFKSSNQLNKAGREFMNIQFGFQNSCLI